MARYKFAYFTFTWTWSLHGLTTSHYLAVLTRQKYYLTTPSLSANSHPFLLPCAKFHLRLDPGRRSTGRRSTVHWHLRCRATQMNCARSRLRSCLNSTTAPCGDLLTSSPQSVQPFAGSDGSVPGSMMTAVARVVYHGCLSGTTDGRKVMVIVRRGSRRYGLCMPCSSGRRTYTGHHALPQMPETRGKCGGPSPPF